MKRRRVLRFRRDSGPIRAVIVMCPASWPLGNLHGAPATQSLAGRLLHELVVNGGRIAGCYLFDVPTQKVALAGYGEHHLFALKQMPLLDRMQLRGEPTSSASRHPTSSKSRG